MQSIFALQKYVIPLRGICERGGEEQTPNIDITPNFMDITPNFMDITGAEYPKEINNLAESHPEKVEEISKLWTEWRASCD